MGCFCVKFCARSRRPRVGDAGRVGFDGGAGVVGLAIISESGESVETPRPFHALTVTGHHMLALATKLESEGQYDEAQRVKEKAYEMCTNAGVYLC